MAVSLARELKGTRITSNIVSPGAILVDAVKELVEGIGPSRGWGETWDETRSNAVEALIPNDRGRFGYPEEIAAAVAYLCSDYAEYLSGSTIRIDGGFIRGAFSNIEELGAMTIIHGFFEVCIGLGWGSLNHISWKRNLIMS